MNTLFKNVRLIATDIDGTLLNSRNELSERFYPAFHQLREAGILFAVASGRQFYNLQDLFAPIKDDLLFIAENGNYVFHQQKELHVQTLGPSVVRELIRLGDNIPGTHLILCGKDTAFIHEPVSPFKEELEKHFLKYQVVDDLNTAADQDILKVTIYDKINSETNSYPVFRQLEDRFKVKVSGKVWLDISDLSSDKGRAIAIVQERFGITPEQTMVFGDYLNDLEMIRQAHFSFAMANAHPQIREAARFQAKSNDDEGVVSVLEQVLESLAIV
jgi:Cof subfamily protein (haloacid dehalogenase superfamily)